MSIDAVVSPKGCLGVDIGATKWVVAGPAGDVRRGPVSDDSAACLAALREAVSGMSSGARTVGVSFAGSVDRHGVVDGWPSRPSWVGRRLSAELFAATGFSGVVADDGVCAALGEQDEAASGLGDYFCLTFGTGLGGVVVVDGKPREGRRRGGRTFGHVRLHGADDSCRCGDRGCLQAVLLGGSPGERSMPRLLEGLRRSRIGALVTDWVAVLGLRGVVLTGGLLGHAPLFAERVAADIRAEAHGLGIHVRVSRTPHDSSVRGARRLARAATGGA